MYILILLISIISLRSDAAGKEKPNFIVMFMDDMGWGDLGCYGNPAKETPNLDKMAAEGMLFTDFYSGSEICSPSRASLLTGRLPIRNGFYSTNERGKNSYTPQDVIGGIPDSEVLLPEILKENGYYNKIIGKWHLGHRSRHLPLKHGFHEWFGAPNCHYKYDNKVMPNIPVYRNTEMTGRYYDDYKFDHETGIGNMTQLYIQEALDFLEAHKKEQFFLYWAPDATHTPLYASKKFRGRSVRGLYGDAVMEIDYGIGRIFSKLEELGLDDNTFVFFSSDNGAATYAGTHGGSNGPFLCGKQTTFEGGMRQPALARWPKRIRAGSVSRQVGTMMDLLPTIAEFAGLRLQKNITLDGESIAKTLLAEEQHDRPVFMYRGDTLFKARYKEYKAHFYTWDTPKDAQGIGYHYCPGQFVPFVTTDNMTDYSKQPLLFHLGRDPGEKFPIHSDSEEYQVMVKVLMKIAANHISSMKPGVAQLDWCDLAVQNWSPNGCEKIGRCLKPPASFPYKCDWPY